jgi:hypothetical protein
MVELVNGGEVNEAPVNIGVKPVAESYQLTTPEQPPAKIVTDEPEQNGALVSTGAVGDGLTITLIEPIGDTQPVFVHVK